MISKEDVLHIAHLARIRLTPGEVDTLAGELGAILTYIDQIKEVGDALADERFVPAHRNVFREDTLPHKAGEYTEALLASSPDTKDGYIKVRKTLEGGR